ncbi:hypothetical protein JI435_424390 [Parastagonospora nodorum SN15]|uniref:Uncharacterized protein n=1 Tax=Phaeosphaeria nodorum (strain SN15 / ATCC MYA-4574 / FGSC 10173) TaxID=321614 RepID=A0A7U2ICW3_PHANO|nr:hypothetical protein JI435_424390 [Parastagonospora nodorum SN15]
MTETRTAKGKEPMRVAVPRKQTRSEPLGPEYAPEA